MTASVDTTTRPWWRQPLLHFLVIGLALFAVWQWMGARNQESGKTIVVDRDSLLTYMQYRAKYFDPERSSGMFDSLTDEQLAQLVEEYIREEVLFREAKALGLDRDDFIIRQRLVQKLEFINRDLSTELTELSEEDLRSYFESHRDDYTAAPLITFTHVFFAEDSDGRRRARARSAEAASDLNTRAVPFHQGARHGDPFFYNVNYIKKSQAEISSHFGRQFAAAVFELEADDGHWVGPVESAYGVHVVMITEQTAGRRLELDEIEDSVRDDASRELIEKRDRAVIDAIVDAYQVVVTDLRVSTDRQSQQGGNSP